MRNRIDTLVRQASSKSDRIQKMFSLIDERSWSITGVTRLMSEDEQWKKMKYYVGEI